MQIFEGLFSYFLRECVSKQGNRQGIRVALPCSVALQEFALTDVSMGGRSRERKEAYFLYLNPVPWSSKNSSFLLHLSNKQQPHIFRDNLFLSFSKDPWREKVTKRKSHSRFKKGL